MLNGVELLLDYIKPSKLMCYVLIGYWSSPDEDLDRVMTLWDDYRIHSFVMPYNKFGRYQKDFARWVNNKIIFKSCSYEEYKNKKYGDYMNEEYCTNCDKKNCVECNKSKRFTIQNICDEKCIFDNLTENMYTKNDLHSICELLNRGKYEI